VQAERQRDKLVEQAQQLLLTQLLDQMEAEAEAVGVQIMLHIRPHKKDRMEAQVLFGYRLLTLQRQDQVVEAVAIMFQIIFQLLLKRGEAADYMVGGEPHQVILAQLH
jgi:hypothetical protein